MTEFYINQAELMHELIKKFPHSPSVIKAVGSLCDQAEQIKLIRCAECSYHKDSASDGKVWCFYYDHLALMDRDGYCSKADTEPMSDIELIEEAEGIETERKNKWELQF